MRYVITSLLACVAVVACAMAAQPNVADRSAISVQPGEADSSAGSTFKQALDRGMIHDKSDNPVSISAVYPTADILPENLLRFYVYFSKPMLRGEVLSSVHLVDSDGHVVKLAFLENKFDLWSPNSKRLTLLFDPGRVKTGLVAHNTSGRALKPNRSYELVIDSTLLALDGSNLESPYRKKFRVVEADFDAPDLKCWKLKKPIAQTKDALTVKLNGSHDHVSLAYRVRVKDGAGNIVKGRIEFGNAEQSWQFVPKNPWTAGSYALTVDPTLEDIAGNRLTGLFERPLAKAGETKSFTIPFDVAERPAIQRSDETTEQRSVTIATLRKT